jgi:hypothetical protein
MMGNSIYWTNYGPEGRSEVVRLGRAGGSPLVLASEESSPRFLALDATRIYWACRDGVIRSVDKTGGQVSTVTSFAGELTGLAVGADVVVWTVRSQGHERNGDLDLILPGALMVAPK